MTEAQAKQRLAQALLDLAGDDNPGANRVYLSKIPKDELELRTGCSSTELRTAFQELHVEFLNDLAETLIFDRSRLEKEAQATVAK